MGRFSPTRTGSLSEFSECAFLDFDHGTSIHLGARDTLNKNVHLWHYVGMRALDVFRWFHVVLPGRMALLARIIRPYFLDTNTLRFLWHYISPSGSWALQSLNGFSCATRLFSERTSLLNRSSPPSMELKADSSVSYTVMLQASTVAAMSMTHLHTLSPSTDV